MLHDVCTRVVLDTFTRPLLSVANVVDLQMRLSLEAYECVPCVTAITSEQEHALAVVSSILCHFCWTRYRALWSKSTLGVHPGYVGSVRGEVE